MVFRSVEILLVFIVTGFQVIIAKEQAMALVNGPPMD